VGGWDYLRLVDSSSSTTANCDLCCSVFVSSVSSLVRLNPVVVTLSNFCLRLV
jgi:hypothetical protein